MKSIYEINRMINKIDNSSEVSDGYHTFKELYHHRMVLFSIICNQNKDVSWKSTKHSDGSMYDDYFIVGITTEFGDYTYHYHIDNWDYFDVKVLDYAPEWDGHKPNDIDRLFSLVDTGETSGNYEKWVYAHVLNVLKEVFDNPDKLVNASVDVDKFLEDIGLIDNKNSVSDIGLEVIIEELNIVLHQ